MTYIGIDLGGTNLRVALFSEDMKIIKQTTIATEAEKGSDQILDKMVDTINSIKQDDTTGVGIAIPGQVDVNTGVAIYSTNLHFDNTPIGSVIKERCNLDAVLNNDANAAGLGEAVSGASSDVTTSYYVTWSTGIGGALVINKKLINGLNMCTGEVGYTVADPSSFSQYNTDMVNGATEALASGTAIRNFAIENNYGDVATLFVAYKNNDAKAVEFIGYITTIFARMLHNIVHVVEVEAIVLGGGVTIKSGDVLLPIVIEKFEQNLIPVLKGKIKICSAELSDDAGLVGAAYLAKSIAE